MKFINKFEEAAYRERLAFNKLIETHKLFKTPDYVITPTPYSGYDAYDFSIHKIDEKFSIKKRIAVEVKVRNLTGDRLEMARKDGWVLESKKLNSLLKLKELDPGFILFYCCITNDGTFFFNLEDLINKNLLKKETMVMNKQTVVSKNDKINKTVYLLKNEMAYLHLPFSYSEERFLKDMRDIDLNRQKKEEVVKRDIVCLFDFLMA